MTAQNSPFECHLDHRFSSFLYYLELIRLNNRTKRYKWQNNPRISPLKCIWRTNVRNMSSGHSINRLFVLVDYANKLSPTLKSVKFASAHSHCPDFLFQILTEEGQRIISILISTRYRAYQDAFQAHKNTQLLLFL